MKKHFASNHRLKWVFSICKDLGIDDPCHWLNSVSPLLVDQWIAYYSSENEKVEATKLSPEDALKALTHGQV